MCLNDFVIPLSKLRKNSLLAGKNASGNPKKPVKPKAQQKSKKGFGNSQPLEVASVKGDEGKNEQDPRQLFPLRLYNKFKVNPVFLGHQS